MKLELDLIKKKFKRPTIDGVLLPKSTMNNPKNKCQHAYAWALVFEKKY